MQNLPHARLKVIPDSGHVPMNSHAKEVSAWLIQSFQSAPEPEPSDKVKPPESQPDYECENQIGGVVTGSYGRMIIDHCTGLILENVSADEIMVRGSVLEVENTEVFNTHIALDIYDSTVVMTAGRLHGQVVANRARVDFAGVEMVQATPFRVGEESRLVISVSRAADNRYLNTDRVLVEMDF